jgi:UPF0755 protein
MLLAESPSGIPVDGRIYQVKKGDTAAALAVRLEKQGAIRSAVLFRLAAKIRGLARDLKTGTYKVTAGMGLMTVLDQIASGKQMLMKLTLPEGLTLRETAGLIDAQGIAKASDFLDLSNDAAFLSTLGIAAASCEGYLFPDTYYMPVDYGAASTMRDLVQNFQSKVAHLPGASGLDAIQLHKKVILASIIEREYRIPDEAPIISSVFSNRMRIGMALQSCATVVYVITEHLKKPHPEIVYDVDLGIKDPYNTYIKAGLPPGPISNPGSVALEAAFAPTVTQWLYFRLIDPESGKHRFSTNLEEHIGAAALIVKRAPGE